MTGTIGGAMVSASQIRNELTFFLAGIISLDEFEDWLVQNTWNIQNTGSKAAEVLTFAIEELLSEYTSGHIPAIRMREELSRTLHAETKNVKISYEAQASWSPKPIWVFTASTPSSLALVAPVPQ
jgi:hypothetical protein